MTGKFDIRIYEDQKVVKRTISGSVIGWFGVHRPFKQLSKPCWKITHLASGMALPGTIRLLSKALDCARELSKIDGANQEYPSQAALTAMKAIFQPYTE